MADTAGPRPTVRLDCVATVAADMARTLGFYRRLGCEVPEGAEQEGHVDLELGAGVRLMVDAWTTLHELGLVEGEEPPSADRPRAGVSLAARCGSPAEVDALYAELAAEGHGVSEPWDAPWGQRYAVLRDPDGTQVDLYAALA
jgi:catechol 2,3-dioxygenase-like lactoylglutathione lyase family enzyme